MTRCKKHKKYKAKRAPKCLCEDCWRYYFYKRAIPIVGSVYAKYALYGTRHC